MNKNSSRVLVSLSLGFFALTSVAGCASTNEATPPVATPEAAKPPPPPPAPPAAENKDETQLHVSDDIAKACEIRVVAPKTHFDFDSAELSTEERDELAQLGKCLTTGGLKGHSILVTGRADPRGEHEYNMSLGAQRANNVVKYLASLGVEAPRMSQSSRGSLDAKGKDEEGWRKDRRVDISLTR